MAIAEASGLFQPSELTDVGAMLAGHFGGEAELNHHWLVDDDEGLAALAYYAPEPFADRVWNLYMLAVHPDRQGGGRGAALVKHVENALKGAGARLLLIETSGLERFERTRTFYQRCGYTEEARIRDYYGQGDDKVVFWKSLTASQQPPSA